MTRILTLILMLCVHRVSVVESRAGELLYNGIVLPEVWPPRHLTPLTGEPMPVPYLQAPPKVIPIDVGRQLFVDDFLIEHTDMQRIFHQARKHEGNPVFNPETPDEVKLASCVYLGVGGVFLDSSEQVSKMFYTAGWRGGLAMATSTDMIHWTRPDLGLVSENLLLPAGARNTGPELKSAGTDNCVWLDLDAKNPAERIKFKTCWMHVAKSERPPGFNHTLQTSDGRTWSPSAPAKLGFDYTTFYHNPFRQTWVYSIKMTTRDAQRYRHYAEHSDFIAGATPRATVPWTAADKLDLPEPAGRYPGAGDPTQLYCVNGVAYESLMLGMHYIHRGPSNEVTGKLLIPKLLDLELGFSRDGFHWSRPDRRGFIVSERKEGAWDRGYVQGAAGVCVVLGDQLIFPYGGMSGIAQDGSRSMYRGCSIGIATLRRDGFASMDAAKKGGTLTTRPVTFKGSHLFVNVANPKGTLRVEVLDASSAVLATSETITADKTKLAVHWKDIADLATFAHQPVRLRFHLTHGSLYAFWVSTDANGASNGYLGAGGPGYPGVRDTSSSSP